MEHDQAEQGDWFQTTIAFVIILVAVVGAIVAWRTTLAVDRAADEDFAGLSASIKREESDVLNAATIYEHYRVYTDYVVQDLMQALLEQDMSEATEEQLPELQAQQVQAQNLADDSREFFFPANFFHFLPISPPDHGTPTPGKGQKAADSLFPSLFILRPIPCSPAG